MKITQDTYVSITYTLKDQNEELIDQTSPESPLKFVYGYNAIVPGLEKGLIDKEVGDKLNIVVPCEEAFGTYDEDLIQFMPRENFKKFEKELKHGMQFMSQNSEGPIRLTVTKIVKQGIEVDGNHPLAGKDLHFDVEILEVRQASEEELQKVKSK